MSHKPVEPRPKSLPPPDETIDVMLDEIAGDGGITLDGQGPSDEERRRALAAVAFLRAIAPRLADAPDTAQARFDIGELLRWPLGDGAGSLEAMREAAKLAPEVAHIARGHRRAALNVSAWRDVVGALDSEARLTGGGAEFDIERAFIQEVKLQHTQVAPISYRKALSRDPENLVALHALERIALSEKDYEAAAKWSRKLSEAIEDPKLSAQYLARSARQVEMAGDPAAALALLGGLDERAVATASVTFVRERLLAACGAWRELVALREQQVEAKLLDRAAGCFDIGMIARWRLQDKTLAQKAFESAAAAAKGDDAANCLRQLVSLAHADGDGERLMAAYQELLAVEKDPEARGHLLHRMAFVARHELGDAAAAEATLERAAALSPPYLPALDDIHRLPGEPLPPERLLELSRVEAGCAGAGEERADALCRLGQLLVAEDDTLDEGIETLEAAFDAEPDSLAALAALTGALRRKGYHERVIELYSRQLERTSSPGRKAWLLGRVDALASERLGDDRRAMGAIRAAAALGASAGPAAAKLRLAEALEGAGELEELADVLASALAALPVEGDGEEARGADSAEQAWVLHWLATAYERLGKDDELADVCRLAVQAAPAAHPVRTLAARAFLHSSRYDELLALLDGGVFSAPALEAKWLWRAANVLDQLGRGEEAATLLGRALELDPSAARVRLALADLLLRDERFAELVEAVRLPDELDDAGERSRWGAWRAVAAEAAGDDEAAARAYQAIEDGAHVGHVASWRLAASCGHWQALTDMYAGAGGSQKRTLHHRYRAAEIAHERLDQGPVAVRHLAEAIGAGRGSVAPLASLLPLVWPIPDLVRAVLKTLAAKTKDDRAKLAYLTMRAHALEAAGEEAQAAETRLEVLDKLPSDPVGSVVVELWLEHQADLPALAAMLRRTASDAALDPGLVAATQAQLGAVLVQIGEMDEAIAAFEQARKPGGPASRNTLVALYRLYQTKGDGPAARALLEELAESLPPGGELGLCLRRIADHWLAEGDAGKATDALCDALAIDPKDYDALRALSELGPDDPRVVEGSLRAFEAETDAHVRVTLGKALAVRLLRAGQADLAHDAIVEVLGADPNDLHAVMLLAEIQARRAEHESAARALGRVADHEDAPLSVRIEALCRLAAVQAGELGDAEGAAATVARVSELAPDDAITQDARLRLAELSGDPAQIVRALTALLEREDVEGEIRDGYLLQLAASQDELGDVAEAVATLGRVESPKHIEALVGSLWAMGDRSERWDLVCDAIDRALGKSATVDADFEADARRRLAELYQGRLAEPAAALAQLERVALLDPSDLALLEDLARASVDSDGDKALMYHRRLLAAEPGRVDIYRTLRQLFVAKDDADGAFCAEAVLVGLGEANDEEKYFYDQRRARHARALTGKLEVAELDVLCPERRHPACRLLAALDPYLEKMFPVDRAGYGLPDVDPAPAGLSRVAQSVARVLGVGDFAIHLVSPRLGPAAEYGSPPNLMLPRSVDDALPREQQVVLGALLSRVALGAIASDPRRLGAVGHTQLGRVLRAAVLLAGEGDRVRASESPVFADVKRRLDEALSHSSRGDGRAAIAAEATAVGAAEEDIDGAWVGRALVRASLRAAVLCASDPAVAIETMKTFAPMFGGPAERGLPAEAMPALAFAVSDDHLRLRRAVMEELP